MNLQSIDFVLQEAMTNLRRDRTITLATVGIVGVAICVLGAATLFLLNLRLLTGKVARELTITAYLQSDVSRGQAISLRSQIGRWPHISSAKLITKEEGWEKFKKVYLAGQRLEQFPIPFTDAIEVRTAAAEELPGVADRLEALQETKKTVPTPEEIHNLRGLPQKAIRLYRGVNIATLILGGLMGMAGLFIIHNTTRLSLFARRREIAIMQLVGATPEFVAGPFLLEGAAHGFIGGLLACALLVPAHMYLRAAAARSRLALIQLLPDDQLLLAASAFIAAGMLLGIIGAWLSLRRFLSHQMESEAH